MQWRKWLGITEAEPYWIYDSEKIYFFYDTPHLLKSVRNNLHKYNVLHQLENGEFGTASWKDDVKLHENDYKRKFKLAPNTYQEVC